MIAETRQQLGNRSQSRSIIRQGGQDSAVMQGQLRCVALGRRAVATQLLLSVPGKLDALQPERAIQAGPAPNGGRSSAENTRFGPRHAERHQTAEAGGRFGRPGAVAANNAEADEAVTQEVAGLVGVHEDTLGRKL